eukprot:TRINITY_DN84943_c0_g1_i1.p2 TRINITY_DN84943_c0_g1~~TRINITY_DN84943_c0_g1_i1.p2  ORF type:complete len:102 (-),score=12.40 TRINITY_DN84943_c0_g1_i1:143-448(-)
MSILELQGSSFGCSTRGSFKDSCNNIRYIESGGKCGVCAECRQADGNYRTACYGVTNGQPDGNSWSETWERANLWNDNGHLRAAGFDPMDMGDDENGCCIM